MLSDQRYYDLHVNATIRRAVVISIVLPPEGAQGQRGNLTWETCPAFPKGQIVFQILLISSCRCIYFEAENLPRRDVYINCFIVLHTQNDDDVCFNLQYHYREI